MKITRITRTTALGVTFAAALVLMAVSGGTSRPDTAHAALPGDDFANAIDVTTPTPSGIAGTADTSGATTEAGEPWRFNNGECEGLPGWSWGATVWFKWTSPDSPGSVRIDTWGSAFNASLVVYTGRAVDSLTPERGACSQGFLSFSANPAIVTLNYAARTDYYIQVGAISGSGEVVLGMATGAELVVTTAVDGNTSDSNLSLREAILLVTGVGLGRAPGAFELDSIAGPHGAGSSDVIRFSDAVFPPGAPATIALSGLLANLAANNDTISGLGVGVIIDGINGFFPGCLAVSGSSNRIEGLRFTRCGKGIDLIGSSNVIGGATFPGQRNVFDGLGNGVFVSSGTGNQITGNRVGGVSGEGVYGIWINGGQGTVIGGAGAAANVISGNDVGVYIGSGSGTTVRGNFIGTDAAGSAIGNRSFGMQLNGGSSTIGGSAPGDANIIAANGYGAIQPGAGIYVGSGSHVIQGNLIGVHPLAGALANAGAGVHLQGSSIFGTLIGTLIGGSDPAAANEIAANDGDGVQVDGTYGSTIQNTIRLNSIHENGGLGINLVNGGNNSRAAPVIQGYLGGALWGYASGCAFCTIDIYAAPDGEGHIYIGSTTTNAGTAFNRPATIHPTWDFTATATDTAGNTSEFSAPFAAEMNQDGDGLPDTTDPCPFSAEDYDGFQDGDGCPDTDNDVDGILDASDTGKQVWDPAGTLPAPTIDCRNIAEDYDSFKDGDGCPEPDNDNDRYADGDDNCDGTDAVTGPDGMLGAPQDLNHNGIRDGPEASFSTDDLMLTFEDFDTVLDTDGCHDSPGDDFDGDGLTDEAEVFTHLTLPYNPDTDADSIPDGPDNCPNWANVGQTLPTWSIPANDSDCDGFTVAREQYVGTDPTKHCNLTVTANDETLDAWPSDFNDSRLTSLADVVLMGPVYNQSTGIDPAKKRFDLNASGVVSLADVVLMGPFYNKGCA